MSASIVSSLLRARRAAGQMHVRERRTARVLGAGLAGLAAVAALVLVPAAPASAHEAAHNVYINGTMFIVDDDWGDDDVAFVPHGGLVQVGPPHPASGQYSARGCADEVRVEVHVAIQDGPSSLPGWVLANVTARLFEGTNCLNNDLDGVTTRAFWIRPNTTTTDVFRVRNNDEPGDYADLRLDVHNAV
jgi:hypothetical protein